MYTQPLLSKLGPLLVESYDFPGGGFKIEVGAVGVRHSCGSRNPGVVILRLWIPVFTGMTPKGLESRHR